MATGLGHTLMSKIDQGLFDTLREMVYRHSGISLGQNKMALVTSRIAKRMRLLKIPTYRDYVDYLTGENEGDELVHFLDAISTNVTSFYREPAHFEFMAKTVKRWLEQGQRRFRLWCAASSTGEEPYTIAMTLAECADLGSLDAKILATDICVTALQHGREAVYERKKLEGVPRELLQRYFARVARRGGPDTRLRASDALRRLIVWKRLNLAAPPFPMRGPMDLVFCRNVMIYFDQDVRRRLVGEAQRLLRPDGYLIVGSAEALSGLGVNFKLVQPSVYRKV